ncbi:MAG: transglycosylase [Candidatus Andersenbacteria bacterium RIFCSPLOWO2_02_FULL_46_11]|nr:MAG: transglycosylase [Candidatus Andersenbacteria bacterium RIFCSPLOWO2_02_FULL_46_11]
MPNLLWTIIVGLISGWLAGYLMQGRGFGLLGNIGVGIVGAVLGGFIFSTLGIAVESTLVEIIMAPIGAVVLLVIIGLIRRGPAVTAP